MKLLGFDTATELCAVGLMVDNKVIGQQVMAPRQHAEIILPLIDKLLREAGLCLKDLDAIAFGQGPGSFMGARIAAGIAQGLAYGVGLPVMPISTLAIMAQQAYLAHGHCQWLIACDAHMNGVYCGAYQVVHEDGAVQGGGMVRAVQADALVSPEALALPDIALEGMVWAAAGNVWEKYQDRFSVSLVPAFVGLYSDVYPFFRPMMQLAKQHFQLGHLVSAFEAEPSYLRTEVAWSGL